MQLELRLFPDSTLSEECVPIDPTAPEVSELAYAMKDLLIPWKAAGLAANQVGYSWRLFVMRISEQPVICVNPSFDPASNRLLVEDLESCLSLPGVQAKVVRWDSVTLKYSDLQGKTHALPLKGFAARVAQHEYEHLTGRTILEHLSPKKLERVLKQYNEKRYAELEEPVVPNSGS